MLLNLGAFEGVTILSPSDFLKMPDRLGTLPAE